MRAALGDLAALLPVLVGAVVEVRRPQLQQPARRMRRIGVLGVEADVEGVRLDVVQPQRVQGVDHPVAGRHALLRREVAVVPDRGGEPARVGGHIGHQRRADHREDGRDRIPQQPAEQPVPLGGGAPAHQSHSTVMIPNTATKYSPDHFTEQAMPRSRPATSRHGRTPAEIPSRGGASPLVCSLALASASRSRKRSRSMSRAPKAARAKTMTKGSSRLVREWTSDSPSIASSSPAISPAVVERNSAARSSPAAVPRLR